MASVPGTVPEPAAATPILDQVRQPADLKGRSVVDLEALAAEIRGELVRIVTRNGGHLGASLGTVELTIALHHVFDSPGDRIVWDVGHQAYVHKLLTGRRERFETIRQEGGLSGFLSRDESEHDAFGAGHASTSISAALGMAVAFEQTGQRRRAVAVIGDGALTGGMAFEALNNAGNLSVPLIVVLNDNEMSIAPNVGAMSKYLDRVRTDRRYNRAKDELARMAERLPQGELLVELGKRWKDSLKEFVYHAMIWEELGFTYMGPVDGHDVRATIDALRQAREVDGPVFLHVVTQKGRGFAAAASDHERSHAVSAPALPTVPGAPPQPPKYQDVFARTVIELANHDPRVVAITAAMPTGTSLAKFQAVHPDRFYDVGIAEQHAVTFAAGLATEGMRPVAGIYSTFLQRAYDQILHDVCLQRLPVVFALDRAGFAGDDGRTHHGVYDLSYLRCLPNITIMAPKDENELRHMLATALDQDAGPVAIRYPRGAGVGVSTDEPLHVLPVGRGELLQEGNDVAIVAVGAMVLPAQRAAEALAAEGIHAAVVNARFVKPLDEQLIVGLALRCGAIVTVEESACVGGFGAAVLETLAAHGLAVPVRVLGVPDRVFEHATQGRLREKAGLTPSGVAAAARALVAAKETAATPGAPGVPVTVGTG
ncbi:MAG: 1-deoxy-D-xylulose 5-phosphate synthase [uncultured Thermomicrobiales bacterium]|uniref:1-deoxy-D-xylulose-5-phosphate synthase n=1 Tax=uncultured Thermomicrobiales bacterium TaxID=1645740 RepID=A0A6J4UFX7_9BACT|nr:MAG: 1-deoxy-D-xylulose 5-phosphate synthase [uncultured Thermomicrobiales bacterium]